MCQVEKNDELFSVNWWKQQLDEVEYVHDLDEIKVVGPEGAPANIIVILDDGEEGFDYNKVADLLDNNFRKLGGSSINFGKKVLNPKNFPIVRELYIDELDDAEISSYKDITVGQLLEDFKVYIENIDSSELKLDEIKVVGSITPQMVTKAIVNKFIKGQESYEHMDMKKFLTDHGWDPNNEKGHSVSQWLESLSKNELQKIYSDTIAINEIKVVRPPKTWDLDKPGVKFENIKPLDILQFTLYVTNNEGKIVPHEVVQQQVDIDQNDIPFRNNPAIRVRDYRGEKALTLDWWFKEQLENYYKRNPKNKNIYESKTGPSKEYIQFLKALPSIKDKLAKIYTAPVIDMAIKDIPMMDQLAQEILSQMKDNYNHAEKLYGPEIVELGKKVNGETRSKEQLDQYYKAHKGLKEIRVVGSFTNFPSLNYDAETMDEFSESYEKVSAYARMSFNNGIDHKLINEALKKYWKNNRSRIIAKWNELFDKDNISTPDEQYAMDVNFSKIRKVIVTKQLTLNDLSTVIKNRFVKWIKEEHNENIDLSKAIVFEGRVGQLIAPLSKYPYNHYISIIYKGEKRNYAFIKVNYGLSPTWEQFIYNEELKEIRVIGQSSEYKEYSVLVDKYNLIINKIEELYDIYKDDSLINQLRSNTTYRKIDPVEFFISYRGISPKERLNSIKTNLKILKKDIYDLIKRYYSDRKQSLRKNTGLKYFKADHGILKLKQIYKDDLGGEEILSEIKVIGKITPSKVIDMWLSLSGNNFDIALLNIAKKYNKGNMSSIYDLVNDLNQLELVNLYNELNNLGKAENINESKDLDSRLFTIKDFVKFACNELGIKSNSFKVKLTKDKKDTETYAHYDPNNKEIVVYVKGRSFLDVCRSIAHEINHHKQNIDGVLTNNSGKDGSPHENESNSKAGVIMRKFGKIYPEGYEKTII